MLLGAERDLEDDLECAGMVEDDVEFIVNEW